MWFLSSNSPQPRSQIRISIYENWLIVWVELHFLAQNAYRLLNQSVEEKIRLRLFWMFFLLNLWNSSSVSFSVRFLFLQCFLYNFISWAFLYIPNFRVNWIMRMLLKLEWGMGNRKLLRLLLMPNYIFQAAIITFFRNVLRQNNGNLPMISSKRERWPSFLVISVREQWIRRYWKSRFQRSRLFRSAPTIGNEIEILWV